VLEDAAVGAVGYGYGLAGVAGGVLEVMLSASKPAPLSRRFQ